MAPRSIAALLGGIIAALLIAVVLQTASSRHAHNDHNAMVAKLSTMHLASVRAAAGALAEVNSQSPDLADSLSTAAYHLQLADDALMFLQPDSRFASPRLIAVSEQLGTARIELQSMALNREFDRLELVKQRIAAIAAQLPPSAGPNATETLLQTLDKLRLP